jgi:hypothetical protein
MISKVYLTCVTKFDNPKIDVEQEKHTSCSLNNFSHGNCVPTVSDLLPADNRERMKTFCAPINPLEDKT